MWAFRRASIHLKNRGLSSGTTRICFVKSEIASLYVENYNAGIIQSLGGILDALVCSRRFYNKSSSSKSYAEVHTFSSQSGATGSEQDGALEDASSEHEALHDVVQEAEATSGDEMDDESISESETDVGEKRSPENKASLLLPEVILAAPASPVSTVLDEWVEGGNEVTQGEVLSTMIYLRKRRLFVKALQLSEWAESTNNIEFNESFYVSRLDLIAKVRGVSKAEEYIQQIPESSRSEKVYRTLLAHWVSAKNTRKSEELFNEMKKLFPLTCFSCNQLLLLYKRTDRKKIADVLSLMEKENIKPSLFTYQALIGAKGQSNDSSGMEQIVEIMKSEGVEPDMRIQASLARHYALTGLKDKAEAVLKEMEGGDIIKSRWACKFLLPVYASLGRDDEVRKIWEVCESNPRLKECKAAIGAWGQLKRIEEAEAVFEKTLKIVKGPSSKHYAALLRVYANHNMIAKANDLVRRMVENGVTVSVEAWDALMKLYARAGEVEKAEAILEQALNQRRGRPAFTSYLTILDQYASRGDVHNAEKMFQKMRRGGYPAQIRSYQSLLYAYVHANAPAYGFSERMKGDHVVPDKRLATLLARADAFR